MLSGTEFDLKLSILTETASVPEDVLSDFPAHERRDPVEDQRGAACDTESSLERSTAGFRRVFYRHSVCWWPERFHDSNEAFLGPRDPHNFITRAKAESIKSDAMEHDTRLPVRVFPHGVDAALSSGFFDSFIL